MQILDYGVRESRYLREIRNSLYVMLRFGLFSCVFDPTSRSSKSTIVRLSEDDIALIEAYLFREVSLDEAFVRRMFPTAIRLMEERSLSLGSLQDVLEFWLVHHRKMGFCETPILTFVAISCVTDNNATEIWKVRDEDGGEHTLFNPLGFTPTKQGDGVFGHNGIIVARQSKTLAEALGSILV